MSLLSISSVACPFCLFLLPLLSVLLSTLLSTYCSICFKSHPFAMSFLCYVVRYMSHSLCRFVCLLIYCLFLRLFNKSGFSDGNSNQQSKQPHPLELIFLIFDPIFLTQLVTPPFAFLLL